MNSSVTRQPLTADCYKPSHPWHYLLGGRPPLPKEIAAHVKASGYEGYRADEIKALDGKTEPARSQGLRRMRHKVVVSLWMNLSRYRQVVFALRAYRKSHPQGGMPSCSEGIHMSVSLKYCHVYNDFAHLIALDDLLSRQPDLFDLL